VNRLIPAAGIAAALVVGGGFGYRSISSAMLERGRESLTWNGHISRVVQSNCKTCHRRGGIAPFSL
jgi:hypothetical protein